MKSCNSTEITEFITNVDPTSLCIVQMQSADHMSNHTILQSIVLACLITNIDKLNGFQVSGSLLVEFVHFLLWSQWQLEEMNFCIWKNVQCFVDS